MARTILFLFVLNFISARAWELPSFLIERRSQEKWNATGFINSSPNSSASTPGRDSIRESKNNSDSTPTTSPTESPAPSPSPSDTPTIEPTITRKPTSKPTESPTESPAPSPSPSDTPSIPPTRSPSSEPSAQPTTTPYPTDYPSANPSDVPTGIPSVSPSASPSVSFQPSKEPSNSPSDVPSLTPTISAEPSQVPSDSPSTSAQPSDHPTHIDGVSGNFIVTLRLQVTSLTKSQIEAFERATSTWVENNDATSGNLGNAITAVIKQEAVNVTIARDETLRLLQSSEVATPVTPAVSIKFTVSALYAGTDNNFILFDELNPLFQSRNPMWVRELAKENDVFVPLQPRLSDLSTSGLGTMQDTTVDSQGMAPVGMASLSLVAVAAVVLAVIASVYSVRSYRTSSYGEELRSPVGSFDEVGENQDTKSDRFHVSIGRMDGTSMSSQEQTYSRNPSQWNNNPASPNSLERGASPDTDINLQSEYRSSADGYGYPNNIQHFQSQQSSIVRHPAKDPPSAASEASFGAVDYSTARPDPNQLSLFDSHSESSSQFSDLSRSLVSTQKANSENQKNEDRGSEQWRESSTVASTAIGENGPELMLTRSMGGTLGAVAANVKFGTLGAAAVTGSYADSQVSDASEFFYMEKNQAKEEKKESDEVTLGARSMETGEEMQLRERTSYESVARRGGLYDVFAPAGPIGIVVDTTKHGPSVHSLKPTSPMLGLITPGDLIIGLDDIDTRGMTAATLTRLMARKSNQKERKITLLAVENY